MATISIVSTALYDDRMSNTAKSRFIRGRRTLAGLGRRDRSRRAEKLSASSDVSGGAANADCWDSSIVLLADNVDDTDVIHLLLDRVLGNSADSWVESEDGDSVPA